MSLSIGIVGLPNVGKSTLFNALTKKSVPAENYPFCTIDPSVGIVAVPDDRLAQLSQFSHSVKIVPAVVEFVDIAGLVKGASKGEGLGNQFLTHIREVDAIAHVVRIFEDDKIIHVHNMIDPVSDIETINLELILADMAIVEKRLEGVVRDMKRDVEKMTKEKDVLERVCAVLEIEKFASTLVFNEEEIIIVRNLQLLTMKPMLYVLNKKAGSKNLDELNDTRYKKLIDFINVYGKHSVLVDAGIENELSSFEGEEKKMFRTELQGELHSTDDGVNDLIKKSYELLGLITYFTTGEDETRGWTILINSSAPEAGAAIHTDFKNKFIRADTIYWQDLITAGSYASAREKGLIRTEGKMYIVKDGDVIEFKHGA